jgi:hypothetical protein
MEFNIGDINIDIGDILIDMEFNIDIGDVHIDMETFYRVRAF